jgi:hypothetical protein
MPEKQYTSRTCCIFSVFLLVYTVSKLFQEKKEKRTGCLPRRAVGFLFYFSFIFPIFSLTIIHRKLSSIHDSIKDEQKVWFYRSSQARQQVRDQFLVKIDPRQGASSRALGGR